ncbi:MAG: UvrB/UvrC motif-containing protein, partial [candidate division Zixibacteria bacterium]|nr:UvrB/UvrC motif-containing protein [candidate division Zixibacteria bacterium]
AEDLADYLAQMDVKVRYLHSEIDAIDRVEILRDLRLAEFDVLVGINLLREGLDLPEVSLVAILDADREGFLRSATALIQIAGRAARNKAGEVIMYADEVTDSMRKALDETNRRRRLQEEYNKKHGITPEGIYKSREDILKTTTFADSRTASPEKSAGSIGEEKLDFLEKLSLEDKIRELQRAMKKAASNLEFEKAALLRDELSRVLEKKGKRSRRPNIFRGKKR